MRLESLEMLWLLILPLLALIFTFTNLISVYQKKIIRLQALIASILILALANPLKDNFQKSGNATLVVDISDSVEPAQIDSLIKQAQDLTAEFNEVSLVAFGAKAEVMANSAKNFSSLASIINSSKNNLKNRSNLEEAIDLGSGLSSNLILLSDGFQNLGNVIGDRKEFSSRIFPLLPKDASLLKKKYFGITSLDLPLISASQKSVEIRTSVQNTTDAEQKGRLKILHDQKEIYSENIKLSPGEEKLFAAQSDPTKEGIKEVKAIFEPENKSFANSLKVAYLSSEQREKVLLLSGTSEDARLLKQAFDGQSYDLVAIQSDHETPELSRFSTVILNNIAANQLQSGFQSKLSEFVRSGGSFVMIGGNRSFGLGGYVGTQIAELLPVNPEPPKAEQKRLTVAVELIIDKSRSMADDSKLEYSKEAARETVRNLKDEDFIGVIGFDSSPFEVVKLGRVGEIKSQAIERIGRLYPAQKTNLFPAMDEGRRRLETVDAGRKHMIILTDGRIPDADQSYLELVKQMRVSGITVSTVLVGSDYDFGFLKDLAERGGGAFYQTADPSSLPRIFLQDVKVRSGEKTMREQHEFPVLVSSSGVRSTSIEDYPEVLGFVQTKIKEGASLELITRTEDGNFPILASWKIDQGKAVAFTSDANGRWSRAWASWSRFVTFWSEVLDSIRSKTDENPIKFDITQQVEGDNLKLDLMLYEDPKGSPIDASIKDPKGILHALNFEQKSKGHYQALLPTNSLSGRYDFIAKVGSRSTTAVAFDIHPTQFNEEKGAGYNLPLLEQLADLSYGKINPQASDLIQSKASVTSSTSYRKELIIFAVILYLLGIILRELQISLLKFLQIGRKATR